MPTPVDYPHSKISDVTAAITGTGTLSSTVDLAGRELIGVLVPTGWASGDIYIRASDQSEGVYAPVYSNGSRVGFTGCAAGYLMVVDNLAQISCLRYIRLESSVNQTDKTLTLLMRQL